MSVKRAFTARNVVIALALVAAAAVVARCSGGSPDSSAGSAVDDADQVWTCSMHPEVRLREPGECPICSMPLAPVSEAAPSAQRSAPLLELSEHARAMASVETVAIERRAMSREIHVVGKVQYNETTLANITTRVEGYVERLFVDYTGVEVQAGDHLVEIYSPDLLVAQQELLIALDGQRNASLVESAKRKLLLWGLTQRQVEDFVRDRKVSDRITLFSPIRGTVVEKMVVQKALVQPGEMLYRLANLESVWVYLDVYEYELPWVQYGQIAEISSEALPGEAFTGRVWFISPVVDEQTRTIKVVLNISNQDRRLKPGMYVSAVIRAELLASGEPAPTGVEGEWSCPMHPLVIEPQPGQCPICKMTLVQIPGVAPSAEARHEHAVLAVPVAAVLDSGMRKLVFVERGVGQYEAVEITTGPRTGDFYPVVSGLREGDRVVVRGNFLLDSQLQIRGLPSLFYEGGPAGASGHQHAGAAQVPTQPAPPAQPQPGPAPPAQAQPQPGPAPLAPPGGHDQHGP